MLERLIEDTKVGKFALDSHPSANALFAENGALERSLDKAVNLTYDHIYGNLDTSNMSDKEKVLRLMGASAIIGTMGTSYVVTESICRGSESLVRGTGKVLKTVGDLAHDKLGFVKSITEVVKETYDNLQNKVSRPVKKKIGRFLQRIKDPLVVGLSVAALALTYGGVRSCGEEEIEPTAIVQPTHYENPTDSIRELFEELETTPTIPEVPRTTPEHRPTPQTIEAPRSVPERIAPLTQFDNRTVLAYCANEMEKDYVLETLQNNNNEVRSIYVNDSETQATIINAHGNAVSVDIKVRGERIPSRNYDIITLRGHVQDMLPLQRDTQSHEAEKTLYVLGGCRSAQFIDDLAQPNRAVIASTSTGYGPMNTYLLLRVIDEMDNNQTWEEMNSDLRRNSARVRNEFVLPNTPEYQRRLGR
jgi:hypothetical protein